MVSRFCISLDFEKKWGILDKNMPYYDEGIRNVDYVIDLMLDAFDKYQIRSTWAFVGMLMFSNKEQMKNILNDNFNINYVNSKLSPVSNIDFKNFDIDLFSGVNSLKKILTYNGQSLASHTFCHSYFNENGVKQKDIVDDKNVFNSFCMEILGVTVNGIIFPRNQVPSEKVPYRYYRSNLNNIFDKGYSESELNLGVKILRTLDCFIPLRKNKVVREELDNNSVLSIPATRFLRSYKKNKVINFLLIKRIKSEMTWAAKNNSLYHLWWHPHNFGFNTKENINNLIEILEHFKFLESEYGMRSVNMNDIYRDLLLNG